MAQKVFLANSLWASSQQKDRFIKNGIWTNNDISSIQRAFNLVQQGDIIILYYSQQTEQITLVTSGTVVSKTKDILNITWNEIGNEEGVMVGRDTSYFQDLSHLERDQIEKLENSLRKGRFKALFKNLLQIVSVYDVGQEKFLETEDLKAPKHALSNEESDERLLGKGYQNQGLIGYLYRVKSDISVPLNQYFLAGVQEYFYFIDENREDLKGVKKSEKKLLGYLATEPAIVPLNLFRYFREEPFWDHFYCSQPDKTSIENLGYEREDNGFKTAFLADKLTQDTVPLYVYSTMPGLKLFKEFKEIDTQQNINSLTKRRVNEPNFSASESFRGVEDLIKSKLSSGAKFLWLNMSRDFWQEAITHPDATFLLEAMNLHDLPKELNEGDIVITKYQKSESISGLFEYVNYDPEAAQAKFKRLYEFSNKPSVGDLKIISGFNDAYTSFSPYKLYELKADLFQEIINTTELGDQGSVWSETPPKIDELHEDESNDATKDKIPFHLDQVVEEDKLGRQPVAKAFADLIKKDVFTDKLNHSFIVHLQGEWGAGKSSFMNFIKKSLNKGDEKWIVVEYNAWQNQHISPPWWTLIDQIYRKSLVNKEYKWRSAIWLCMTEVFRRFRWYTGWQKVASFLIVAVLLAIIAYFKVEIVGEAIKLSGANGWLEKLTSFIKLLPAIAAFIGVIYSFATFITTPFFIKSSNEAKSFVLRAADPMSRVKQHFSKLVNTINIKGKRQLAIFIDDIDRCNKEFIVELLEGIQTLFKEKRVLFIVAGDKKWIVKSFGNTYKEFSNDTNNADQLGENFLEKAFQLSFRMPNVSDDAKEDFWNHIIGYSPENEEQKEIDVESIQDLSVEQKQKVETFIKGENLDISNPESMKKMQDTLNFSADTVSNIVIEKKNESSEDLKHLLQEFHPFIDSNPRSIIRLANNYTMTRSTLIAERKSHVPERKIFRWLIIEDLIPEITKLSIESVDLPVISEFINNVKESSNRDNSLKLLNDTKDEFGGALTAKEIRIIKGV